MSHYDDSLARFPYTGFRSGDDMPIAPGAVQAGGFRVTVAGHRYGKGSSREHSPAAEKLAGIGLVIARSFERIYRQNADNIGLLTSTDFGLVERIQRGEPIPIDELLAGRDELAAGILRSGGLLRFGREHLRASGRAGPGAAVAAPLAPRTLFEKIIERHLLTTPVTPPSPRPGDGAFVRADWRFIHEYYTGMAAHMLHSEFGRPLQLFEPETRGRVRGPHLLRGPEPRAPARRPGAQHARHVPGPAGLRRHLRPALSPHAHRRGSRQRTTARTSRASPTP